MKRKIQVIALVLFICLPSVKSIAQQDLTIYSCNAIPQANYTNPTIIPDAKVHFGLPVISSFYVGAGHSGFHIHKVLQEVDNKLFINGDKMVDMLPNRSFINFNTNIDLLSFGFKILNRHYFNFSASNKMFMRFGYPKNLIEFLNKSSEAMTDANISFTKTGLNFTVYNEYMFGYTGKITDKLTVGGHFKFLQGISNISIKKSDVGLYTDTENDYYTIYADIDAYAAMPNYVWDENGTPNINDLISSMKNNGYGVDLGASFSLTDRLSVGGSILDLGAINWTQGTRRYRSVNPDGQFTFEGADFSEFFLGDENSESTFSDRLNYLVDTLASIFKLDTLYESYTTPLNTSVNAHAFYDLNKNNRLSGLIRTQFFLEAVHASLSVGYTHDFGRFVTLAGTYSISSRKYDNFGLALSLKLGGTQFYITTDNAPVITKKFTWGDNKEHKLVVPKNTKYFNLHFGINFNLGYKSSN